MEMELDPFYGFIIRAHFEGRGLLELPRDKDGFLEKLVELEIAADPVALALLQLFDLLDRHDGLGIEAVLRFGHLDVDAGGVVGQGDRIGSSSVLRHARIGFVDVSVDGEVSGLIGQKLFYRMDVEEVIAFADGFFSRGLDALKEALLRGLNCGFAVRRLDFRSLGLLWFD